MFSLQFDLLLALITFTLAVAYIFGLRPILKQTPAFADFYATEDSFFAAFSGKFSGLKQKLTTLLLSSAASVVLLYDSAVAALSSFGFDVTQLPATLLPDVPQWVWPVAFMSVLWLINKFRAIADQNARANAEALLSVGAPLAAPAPGLPVTTQPSPSPLPVK
jgi:hypothetical protein